MTERKVMRPKIDTEQENPVIINIKSIESSVDR